MSAPRRPSLANRLAESGALIIALPLLLAVVALTTPTTAPAPSAPTPSSPASGTPPPTPIGQFEELLPISTGFAPTATRVGDCAPSDLLCLAQAYGNLAYTSGTAAAGDALRAAMANDPFVAAACHPIAHGIGIAAIARETDDAAVALRDGFPDCGNGFYHGVLLRAFAGFEDAAPETLGLIGRELCGQPAILADRNLMINCVHGTGHGYMISTAFDMERSIAACAAAGEIGSASISQCDNGVFMEVFDGSDGQPSAYLSATNPFAPCDRVSDPDKLQCYTYSTGQVMGQAGGANAEALRICGTAEPIGQAPCFANIGSVIAANGSSPAETMAICATATGAGVSDCLNGAARQVVFYAVDGVRLGGDYCAVGGALAETCYASIGDLIAFQGIGDPETLCATFTPASAVEACRRGASGVELQP
jgi:hypothetical protein